MDANTNDILLIVALNIIDNDNNDNNKNESVITNNKHVFAHTLMHINWTLLSNQSPEKILLGWREFSDYNKHIIYIDTYSCSMHIHLLTQSAWPPLSNGVTFASWCILTVNCVIFSTQLFSFNTAKPEQRWPLLADDSFKEISRNCVLINLLCIYQYQNDDKSSLF